MKKINEYQKNLYEQYDSNGSILQLEKYVPYLDRFMSKKPIKILDIGGASGHFAYAVKNLFQDCLATVYVIDPTTYGTWEKEKLGSEINFIHDSVENIESLFEPNSFDIIFANRVLHHCIDTTWKSTLLGIDNILLSIKHLLKPDGLLLIMEHFYNGQIVDASTSYLIYKITSIKSPFIAKAVRRLGAATAGVGVCFQSEKMWINRLQGCGFRITVHKADSYRLKRIKRLCLLSKSVSLDNIIVAHPQNTL